MINKSSRNRIIESKKIIMQPRFGIKVLVLQPERLVRRSRYVSLLFQTTPTCIVAKPQEVAVLIGHLTRDADVVAMEIVGLLLAVIFCIRPITDLRQRFVGVLVGVDIGVEAV